MNKVLLIIDPQYDFITGSLKCKDAINKMTDLAYYIREKGSSYDSIVITLDWHPINHCSFVENGGEWPMHCVAYTQGASVYQDIIDRLPKDKKVYFLTKGDMCNVEEYSIMKNHASYALLTTFILNKEDTIIDICGIANEFCVLNTVKDLVECGHKENITILFDYIACVKSNEPLLSYVYANNIKVK